MQTVLKMGKLLSRDAQKKIKGGLFGGCDCDPLAGPCPGVYYCCLGDSSTTNCRRVQNYNAAVQWVASQSNNPEPAWCYPWSMFFCDNGMA